MKLLDDRVDKMLELAEGDYQVVEDFNVKATEYSHGEFYANLGELVGDEDLYYDYGANERFSLKGRGLGECSTGVLDVIQLDLSNAKASLEKYKETNDNQYLFQSALSSARTLLILKGVDTNKNKEILKKFVEHFVETGYVKPSIKELFENLIDDKQGSLDKIADKLPEIDYLYNRVKEIYESLNGSLEFPSKEQVNP